MSFNALGFLELEAVNFAYPERGNVVKDISLTLAPGEIHCLIGRSGCGKTTISHQKQPKSYGSGLELKTGQAS